jgi:hypothetical protein
MGVEIVRFQAASHLEAGDWLIGHPGLWKRVWELPAGVTAVNSGGTTAAPPAGGRWLDVYGSTETAGIGWRESAERPFELFPYWPDCMNGVTAPDRLEWVTEREFFLGGRVDGRVQVSGMNVDLAAIERTLARCEGVRQVAVRLRPPALGGRLKAFIVGDVIEEAVRQYADLHLPSWERPAQYTFGPSLPLTGAGKPKDWT